MQNNSKTISTIISIILLLTFAIYGSLYSLSFELGWNESFQLYQSLHPLSSYFELIYKPFEWAVAPDRGPIESILLNTLYLFGIDDIYFIRQLSYWLLILTLIYLFRFFSKRSGPLIAVLTCSFIFFNFDLFSKSNLISIYSFNFLFTQLMILSFARFDGSLRSFLFFTLFSTLATFSLYVSVLPFFICLFLLFKKNLVASKKYLLLLIPNFIYTLVKGYMIFKYRFLERNFYSDFINYNVTKKLSVLLDFFGINSLSGSYSLSLALTIILMIFVLIFLLNKRTDNYLIFIKYYIISALVTFFIMSYSGAEEIETRYYFALLPHLFYSLLFLMNKEVNYLIIPALAFLVVSNFYSNIKAYRSLPLSSIYDLLKSKSLNQHLICTPESSSKIHHLERLSSYRNKDRYNSIRGCNQNTSLSQLNKEKEVVIITWKEKFGDKSTCSESDSKYCFKKDALISLKKRKQIAYYYLKPYKNNHSAHIYVLK